LPEAVTLLTYISEMSGTSLSPEAGYRGWGLCGFPQPLQANVRIVFQIKPTFPSRFFPIYYTDHATIQRCML
jgi:hypothetical protein